MAATIKRLVPVTRNQGAPIAGLVQAGMWVDAVVLVAGVAQSYTIPGTAPAKGSILRLSANAGPIYANFAGTAAVPVANVLGTSSILLRTDLGPVILAIPDAATALSLFCPSAAIITIEAWC